MLYLKVLQPIQTYVIVPQLTLSTTTFLVDQSKLKLQSDLKADDCGAWKNNGVCCVVIFLTTIVARKRKLKPTK